MFRHIESWKTTALLCGWSSNAILKSCQFAYVNPNKLKNFALPPFCR
jgi:hypothetical protein